ncbi:hypothetical protein NDU88_003964 [Pleurodeles waltl]|uniref:Uncharacterized protein n=1 Tax=Pleurodeles waltl TaxID=8319 RepID=A0AAV7UFU0_PLEWA|nr:hypothetical protein NDU88_003964 [Pleurodeles waltl]
MGVWDVPRRRAWLVSGPQGEARPACMGCLVLLRAPGGCFLAPAGEGCVVSAAEGGLSAVLLGHTPPLEAFFTSGSPRPGVALLLVACRRRRGLFCPPSAAAELHGPGGGRRGGVWLQGASCAAKCLGFGPRCCAG